MHVYLYYRLTPIKCACSTTLMCLNHRLCAQTISQIVEIALLLQVAAPFDVEQLQRQYPATYQESMNTVLVQEALRYNALLEVVAASLKECGKAVKGLVVMSPSLEAVSNSMYDNQVQSGCMLAIYTHGHVVRIAARSVSLTAPNVTCSGCRFYDCASGGMTGSTYTSCKALAHVA